MRQYIYDTWPDNIVRIVRTNERSGLIRARIAGAKAAVGDVLIFLDAHCEASPGWYVQIASFIFDYQYFCFKYSLLNSNSTFCMLFSFYKNYFALMMQSFNKEMTRIIKRVMSGWALIGRDIRKEKCKLRYVCTDVVVE